MGTGELLGKPKKNCAGMTCDGLASRPGGVEILLAASCYRNRDKLRQLWAILGSKASHTSSDQGIQLFICNCCVLLNFTLQRNREWIKVPHELRSHLSNCILFIIFFHYTGATHPHTPVHWQRSFGCYRQLSKPMIPTLGKKRSKIA